MIRMLKYDMKVFSQCLRRIIDVRKMNRELTQLEKDGLIRRYREAVEQAIVMTKCYLDFLRIRYTPEPEKVLKIVEQRGLLNSSEWNEIYKFKIYHIYREMQYDEIDSQKLILKKYLPELIRFRREMIIEIADLWT